MSEVNQGRIEREGRMLDAKMGPISLTLISLLVVVVLSFNGITA